MAPHRSLLFLAVTVTVAVMSAPRHATAGEATIAVEVLVGPHPETPDDLSREVAARFSAAGFITVPLQVDAALRTRAPRPGLSDRAVMAKDLIAPVERGLALWSEGQFGPSETALLAALAQIHANPAALASDTKHADLVYRAMATLALSQWKQGQTVRAAAERGHASLVDLARAFPDRPLTRDRYPPDAVALYREIADEVGAMGVGTLAVKVDDSQALIFIDSQLRGIGSVTIADAVPGTHRVFVQVPSTEGRRYEIDVTAGKTAELTVDWQTEHAFRAGPAWVGFAFATDASRDRSRFARAVAGWSMSDLAVVIERARQGDLSIVRGSLVRATGEIVRSGAARAGAERGDDLDALARYLADGTTSPRLLDLGRPTSAPRADGDANRTEAGGGTRAIPLLAVALGGAAAAVGAGLVATDGTDPDLAVGITTAGSTLAAVGGYLALRDAGVSRLPAATISVGAAAVVAGFTWMATADVNTTTPSAERRDVAIPATVVVVAGTILACGGPVLSMLTERNVQPVAWVTARTSGVGLAGSF